MSTASSLSHYRGAFTRATGDGYLVRDPSEVVAVPLSERVWTVTMGSYRTIVIDGGSSLVAVNTFGTPAQAESYRAVLAQVFPDKPVEVLVQTIDHLDHAGWGQVFAPEAEVISHELAGAVIAGRGSDGQRLPDTVVTGEATTIKRCGVELVLEYPGPTVGTGNIAVHVPEEDVTFVVGPQHGARYGLFADVHFRHFVPGLRQVVANGGSIVVPGRRDVLDRASATRALDYLDDFQEACQHAMVDGSVTIWLLEPVGQYLYERLKSRWGDLDGFDVPTLGLGGARCINYYYMGGWALDDTKEPERLYQHPAVKAFRTRGTSVEQPGTGVEIAPSGGQSR